MDRHYHYLLKNFSNYKRSHVLKAIAALSKFLGLYGEFRDLREYWASKMVKYLKQPEIDFLMGHVTANVFMANYFNLIWIKDLKDRALKGEREILKEINKNHSLFTEKV
ncbi:MAG: hypothetical protein QW707_06525 [Candidatus Bathyarchaeia archaeon]